MQFSSEIDLELGQLILLPLGEKKTFIAFLNSQFDAIFSPQCSKCSVLYFLVLSMENAVVEILA